MSAPLAVFGSLGIPELVIILGIATLLFGAKKIPALARGIGESIRELRSATKEGEKAERDLRELNR